MLIKLSLLTIKRIKTNQYKTKKKVPHDSMLTTIQTNLATLKKQRQIKVIKNLKCTPYTAVGKKKQ